mgnify:CR=1 FL=1
MIEVTGLAQLDNAFERAATRSEPIEGLHFGVNSLVRNAHVLCGAVKIAPQSAAKSTSDKSAAGRLLGERWRSKPSPQYALISGSGRVWILGNSPGNLGHAHARMRVV